MPRGEAEEDEQGADDAANEDAQNQGEDNQLKAEHGSHCHGEGHVAKAKGTGAKNDLANPIKDIEDEEACHRPHGRRPPTVPHQKFAQANGQQGGGEGDNVQNEPMLHIYDND